MSTDGAAWRDQKVVPCDERGVQIGDPVSRLAAHTDPGIRHLAIVVMLQNDRGDLLLQLRKHALFDHMWDVTGATHPMVIDGQQEDLATAVQRCVRSEWNVELTELHEVARFNYYEKLGSMCESEHCVAFTARVASEPRHDPGSAYESRWVPTDSFPDLVRRTPSEFTPWAIELARIWPKPTSERV